MKTKTCAQLTSMYDAVRLLEKAKAALYAGGEPLLAGKAGSVMRETEINIETFEVIECRASIHKAFENK